MITNIETLNKEVIESQVDIEKSWDPSMAKKCKFVDGKLAIMDLGRRVKVFIHPTTRQVEDEEGVKEITEAYSIVCDKPITYGKLINFAEKQEYDEINLGEITAINRKGRQNPEDQDVVVHDAFIAWVKEGLHAIGY